MHFKLHLMNFAEFINSPRMTNKPILLFALFNYSLTICFHIKLVLNIGVKVIL